MTLRVRVFAVLVGLLCALSLQANNVFVLPNGTTETNVQVYTGNPVAPAGSYPSGPAPVRSISALPDGSRFYTISNSVTDALVVTDGGFSVTSRSGAWNDPGRDGAVTPDGKYFLAVAGTLRIFSTATGQEVASIPAGSSPVGVAVTIDSRYALVLSTISNRLYRIDLNTLKEAGSPLSVFGNPTALAAGPNGYIYVSTTNAIAVIDPETMTEVGRVSVSGTPNQMYFTPDGKYGIATNQRPLTNVSVWIINLATNSVQSFVGRLGDNVNVITMTPRVEVVSNERFFMTSTRSRVIYEVTIPDAELDVPVISGDGRPDQVDGMVKSGEMPNAKYLYYIEGEALKRASLNPDSLSGSPVATPFEGTGLIYEGPSSNAPPASAILYNDKQNIGEEGAFRPIVIRALDSNGLPVFNAPVVFEAPQGVQFTRAMTATNKYGLAMATVDPGDVTGPIPVQVTVGGSLTETFELAVGGAGGGDEGGIAIESGQGQLNATTFFFPKPLRVKVTAPGGTPINGATVGWAIAQGRGNLDRASSKTNVDGIAEATFFGPNLLEPGLSYEQAVINATYENQAVTFYVTTIPIDAFGSLQVNVEVRKPSLIQREFEGRVGEVSPGFAVAFVGALAGVQAGEGIPNIALEFLTGLMPGEGPFVQCQGAFALTDANGEAVCDLVYGGLPGRARASLVVGSNFTIPSDNYYTVTVLPGAPAAVVEVDGDGQTGDPGETLPDALLVRVLDAAGNPLPGAAVTWEVLQPGRATLSNVQTVTDSLGRASAKVTLGATPGPVSVRVRSGAASFTFSLTVDVVVTSLTMVSGNNQTAETGAQFGQPLVVELKDESGAPVVGQQVQFAVTGGSGAIGSPSATTDAQGRASTTVTAGSSAGPLTIRASFGSLSPLTFNLTVRLPGPGVLASSFTNGASGQPGVVPGSVVKIVAPGLAPGIQNCLLPGLIGILPFELGGVTVQFGPDSAPLFAPIFYVCNVNGEESVAIQAPFELPTGNVRAKVTVSGGSTVVESVPVFAVQPGLFESVGGDGLRHAVVMRPNGSLVSPSNPAQRGELLWLFATGLGAVSPASATGVPGAGQSVVANLVVGVNNAGVRVVGGEYSPGAVGIYRVQFEVPADTATGPNRPFALAVRTPDGQLIFGNGSSIAIQ